MPEDRRPVGREPASERLVAPEEQDRGVPRGRASRDPVARGLERDSSDAAPGLADVLGQSTGGRVGFVPALDHDRAGGTETELALERGAHGIELRLLGRVIPEPEGAGDDRAQSSVEADDPRVPLVGYHRENRERDLGDDRSERIARGALDENPRICLDFRPPLLLLRSLHRACLKEVALAPLPRRGKPPGTSYREALYSGM